jgi:GDP-L-fucose synthase
MKNDIIVTGGSGMVGSAFKSIIPNADYPDRESFHNLDFDAKEKSIIHLAAKVGGVKANMNQIADFYYENSIINQKLLEYARREGSTKVVSLLSTCVYPDASHVSYPLTEDQLHLGPPHSSNFGYAYAKRMVDVMSRSYRQQYGCNFITAIPNNLYGENDNFDLENSHVIPAIIRKVLESKMENKPFVKLWGDGTPLREFTYSQDIAKILLFLLENYNDPEPINIGNTQEYSISQIADTICSILDYEGEVIWDTSMPSGQYRKPSSNQKLIDLGWKKEWYTSLQKGLTQTCNWVILRYPNIRGIK